MLTIVDHASKLIMRMHLSKSGDQPKEYTRELMVSRRRVCRRIEPVVRIYHGSNEGEVAVLSASLCHGPLV
jgi:hypothetical protein